MKKFTVLAVVAINLSIPAKAETPTSIILDGNFTISGTQGHISLTLLVDAATPDRPVLNPDFAEQIGIAKSFIGARFAIGPVHVSANTKVLEYTLNGEAMKRRSLWADKPYTKKYDGGVGPGGIPQNIVTFQLRARQADEKEFILPLIMNGNSVAQMKVGGKMIDISFTQKRTRSLATAAAGAIIAENYGGTFTGVTENTEIAYGIERPIRALQISSPINFIGRSLSHFFVRTKDHGDASGIIDGDTLPKDIDDSEIVVTGKKDSDKNRYSLTLGRDDLSHCSSYTYDKIEKVIRLFCKAD